MMPTDRSDQRGATALVVTLLLFLALALAALGLNRHLILEQRSAAHQARATQAFEATEAGLAWAQARLNDPTPIGADCRRSTDPAATSFRARYLVLDRASGAITTGPLQPSCVRGAGGWSCSCPAGVMNGAGTVSPPPPPGTELAPAFVVRFEAGARAGAVRVLADGCTSPAGVCAAGTPGTTSASDANARGEVALALFAGLQAPPTVAMTVRPATQTPAQFFAARFGVDKTTWQNQSVVAHVACGSDCGAQLTAAAQAGHQLIWIDGDLDLAGPATLGTSAHPLVLVASGAARLSAAVAIVGVVYARSVALIGTDPTLRGAALSEDGDSGSAPAGLQHDAYVLAALAHQTGSFARVGGGWRDF